MVLELKVLLLHITRICTFILPVTKVNVGRGMWEILRLALAWKWDLISPNETTKQAYKLDPNKMWWDCESDNPKVNQSKAAFYFNWPKNNTNSTKTTTASSKQLQWILIIFRMSGRASELRVTVWQENWQAPWRCESEWKQSWEQQLVGGFGRGSSLLKSYYIKAKNNYHWRQQKPHDMGVSRGEGRQGSGAYREAMGSGE